MTQFLLKKFTLLKKKTDGQRTYKTESLINSLQYIDLIWILFKQSIWEKQFKNFITYVQ